MKITLPFHCAPASQENRNGFFTGFFNARVKNMPGCCPVLEYPAEANILREGQFAQMVYLIESGLVKLSQIQPSGARVTAGIRGKHWLLGAAAFLLGAPYSFTATALTTCRLRHIRTIDFEHLARTDHEFSWNLCKMLSWEVKSNLAKVVELGAMNGRERLRRLLADMVAEVYHYGTDNDPEIHFPLKQHELAQLICVTPEHLCRIMKTLEQEGLIARDRGTIVILDPARMLETLE